MVDGLAILGQGSGFVFAKECFELDEKGEGGGCEGGAECVEQGATM